MCSIGIFAWDWGWRGALWVVLYFYTDRIIEAIGLTSLCNCIINVCPIPISDDNGHFNHEQNLLRDINRKTAMITMMIMMITMVMMMITMVMMMITMMMMMMVINMMMIIMT